jgi:predicted ABC-class ATPase
MNSLSKNPETTSKIKRLIKNQHDNERQWWAGREALVAKHKGRVESKKKADDLLRSLGAVNSCGTGGSSSSAAEEKAELERYDKKVYAALGQMTAAIDRELTVLRVPFFAIRHDLVSKAEEVNGLLNKAKLIELQKKMLHLLEDLFAD